MIPRSNLSLNEKLHTRIIRPLARDELTAVLVPRMGTLNGIVHLAGRGTLTCIGI